MKKVLLFLVVIALIAVIPVSFAFAETAEEEQPEQPVITEQPIDNNWFKENMMAWLFGGGTGGIIVALFVKTLIKYVGENKSVKAAYAILKDTAEKKDNELDTLRQFKEQFNVEAVLNMAVSDIIKAVISDVGGLISHELDKRTDLSAKIFANSEVLTAKLDNFTKAALLAWREVDGAGKLLAASPNTAVMERQAAEIQFLKTYVAEKLGMETAELQAEIEKAVS